MPRGSTTGRNDDTVVGNGKRCGRRFEDEEENKEGRRNERRCVEHTKREKERQRKGHTERETTRRNKERECTPMKERESKSWRRSARKRRSMV